MRRWLAFVGAVTGVLWVAYRWFGRQRPLGAAPAMSLPSSYESAAQHARSWLEEPAGGVISGCEGIFLTHGRRTHRAIVLLHGFTNCPEQYVELAPAFFALGYNVLAPRFPGHGMIEKGPQSLQEMSAEGLMGTAARAIDIAHGLGDHVTVLGLSMGGLTAAWVAQNRGDVDEVVLVAPALAYLAVPRCVQGVVANLFLRLPDAVRWWDPKLMADAPGPAHAYRGFTTQSFAQMARFALLVLQQAGKQAPQVNTLIVVTNPCDEAVNNTGAAQLGRSWERHGATVMRHVFPADWGLPHDLIDPANAGPHLDRVYPLLVEWTDLKVHQSEQSAMVN
ncbi:MAG: alpha/beta hydrolase [Anaerolineales bacterium]|nr:alpha/beta hydrolase [Anaerolineales bacterium]